MPYPSANKAPRALPHAESLPLLARSVLCAITLAAGSSTTAAAGSLVAKIWAEAGRPEWISLGRIGGFYRNTQLQGHLVADGLHLESVPAFWIKGSDFPYMKRASAQEVFFVDRISITRFLGGYPQHWKHGGTQLPANDLAFRDEKGLIQVRRELIGPRLQRYIDNGYTEFTIGMENVPWALSRDPSKSGPYGSTEPPADWKEWSMFIEDVCRGIEQSCPAEVTSRLRFKIGNEYNSRESFSGSHEDFLRYYRETSAAIRKIFPKVPLMPGEFAGAPVAESDGVDYIKLFRQLARDRPSPTPAVSAIVRSCHAFPHVKDIGPRERIESAVGSFRQILEGTPRHFRDALSCEYSQFGVLGSSLGDSVNDTGVRAASWQFQVMFRARGAGLLDRCWAWDKSEEVAAGGRVTHFLNGVGWLYSVLDHVRGDRAWLASPRQRTDSNRDVSAAVFVRSDRILVLLASWTPLPSTSTAPEPVQVRLPRSDMPFIPDLRNCRTIALDDDDSVGGCWRRDLAAVSNLKTAFSAPDSRPSTIESMAIDPASARSMIFSRLADYEAIQQKSLTLQAVPAELAEIRNTGTTVDLTVLLRPDDLRVLVFGARGIR